MGIRRSVNLESKLDQWYKERAIQEKRSQVNLLDLVLEKWAISEGYKPDDKPAQPAQAPAKAAAKKAAAKKPSKAA